MKNLSINKINGVTYYQAEDARGNKTMVQRSNGEIFISTNRTPARNIDSVQRVSKVANTLVEMMLADEAKAEAGKPRVTYAQVVEALEAGYESPLNSYNMRAPVFGERITDKNGGDYVVTCVNDFSVDKESTMHKALVSEGYKPMTFEVKRARANGQISVGCPNHLFYQRVDGSFYRAY